MHPAMRLYPARWALGVPTIMNIVGPFSQSLSLDSQLMEFIEKTSSWIWPML